MLFVRKNTIRKIKKRLLISKIEKFIDAIVYGVLDKNIIQGQNGKSGNMYSEIILFFIDIFPLTEYNIH